MIQELIDLRSSILQGKIITYYPLPITHYPLPITHYPLPITHYPLPLTHYLLLRFWSEP